MFAYSNVHTTIHRNHWTLVLCVCTLCLGRHCDNIWVVPLGEMCFTEHISPVWIFLLPSLFTFMRPSGWALYLIYHCITQYLLHPHIQLCPYIAYHSSYIPIKETWSWKFWNKLVEYVSCDFCTHCIQVATALLVASSTVTFWIPWQTLHTPARTQASFKAMGCSYNCMLLTYGWFQLTHVTWWPHTGHLQQGS